MLAGKFNIVSARIRYLSMSRLPIAVCCLLVFSTAAAGTMMEPEREPWDRQTLAETFGEGDTIEFNTSDLDLEIGTTRTRVARVQNEGIRTDTYEIWTSTSGDAGVYTEFRNVDRVTGDRARFTVEGRSTRGISLTFAPSTCYRSTCGGSLTVHVQNRETGERFDMDMQLTIDRGVQGVQAPGVQPVHLVVLVLLAGAVVLVTGPRD